MIYLATRLIYCCHILGGAIDDFSKSVAEIPFVATVELPGTHSDG